MGGEGKSEGGRAGRVDGRGGVRRGDEAMRRRGTSRTQLSKSWGKTGGEQVWMDLVMRPAPLYVF